MLRAIACTLLVVALTVDPVVSVQCGIAHQSSRRIVGGREASPHAYPWIAYIQTEYTSSEGLPTMYAACDGSLIDDQWVITASHCFGPHPNYQIHRVAIVLGAHNLANRTEHRIIVSPKHILRNGNYQDGQPASKYDITMVQLPQKVTFSHDVAPICMPVEGGAVSKSECKAIGWGKVGGGEHDPSSPVLKEVDLNMLSASECKTQHPEISDTQVCAGYAQHGACQGDSGGPLMCKNSQGAYVLVGITSYGDKVCGGSRPAVFTNVEKYLSWVKRVKTDYP